jgi:hypothetical protein
MTYNYVLRVTSSARPNMIHRWNSLMLQHRNPARIMNNWKMLMNENGSQPHITNIDPNQLMEHNIQHRNQCKWRSLMRRHIDHKHKRYMK